MSDVETVRAIVAGYADCFATACRSSAAAPARDPLTVANDRTREGRLVKWDVQPDEAAAFLRAVQSGHVAVKPTGRFWASTARSSSRNLHLVGRSGAGTALHTEYLIHLGAYAELILDLGWPPELLDFECGSFDVEGGEPRISLATEAKARILPATGDTLIALRDALLWKCDDPSLVLKANHANKWTRLFDLTAIGPVWLWLVADNARWSWIATRSARCGIELREIDEPPTFEQVQSLG